MLVRMLLNNADEVCAQAGIERSHVPKLASLFGVNVIFRTPRTMPPPAPWRLGPRVNEIFCVHPGSCKKPPSS